MVLHVWRRMSQPTQKTLWLSLALALLELILWFSLGLLASSSSEDQYAALIAYCAERFGEIAVAIATTFYVVFTYGLLKNSEVHRRQSTEPHLVIRWYQLPEHTDNQLSQMDLFAQNTRNWLVDVIGLPPNSIDGTGMVTGNRYLTLELCNVRKTPVGWLKLAVSGKLEIPDKQPVQFGDGLYLQDLQLGEGETAQITIADLFPIPQAASVIVDVDFINYGAIDGGDVLRNISGATQFSAAGEFAPTDWKGPQPTGS